MDLSSAEESNRQIFAAEKMKIKIIKGWGMKPGLLKEINRLWQKEFSGNDSVMPGNRKDFAEDTFFVLFDGKKILSTGRLRRVAVRFMGREHKIKGIADIASAIKGKGHGKKIMQAMHKYLDNKKQIGIGFCMRKNSPFYRKSGLKIAAALAERFIYKNSRGKFVKCSPDTDVIYSIKGKNLINLIIRHPKEKVLMPGRPW